MDCWPRPALKRGLEGPPVQPRGHAVVRTHSWDLMCLSRVGQIWKGENCSELRRDRLVAPCSENRLPKTHAEKIANHEY